MGAFSSSLVCWWWAIKPHACAFFNQKCAIIYCLIWFLSGDTSGLEFLFLHNNQLSGNIPIEIKQLTQLEGMLLSGNCLTATNSRLVDFLNDKSPDWQDQRTDCTPERSQTNWQVAEIYLATTGAAPDAEGLDYWIRRVDTDSVWTPTTVAQSFFDQPLVQQQYPESLGHQALIEALYQNIFGRAVDAQGLQYWLDELSSGRIQRNQMIIALINGGWANTDAATDMARFGHRVEVALAFAAHQRQHRIVYSQLSAADQVALREAGRLVIAGVTADESTRDAAIASIPGLLAGFGHATTGVSIVTREATGKHANSAQWQRPVEPVRRLTWSELPQALRDIVVDHGAVIEHPQASHEGDWIVFATDAALVWNDTNAHSDIYAYDPSNGNLTLISATVEDQAANSPSVHPQLAGDGQSIIYQSAATDLGATPGNGFIQLYHYDRALGHTQRLTDGLDDLPGNGDSTDVILAGDWVIYRTNADNLDPAHAGLYRQHRTLGLREVIGLDLWGQPLADAAHPAASADGEHIAYQSTDEHGVLQIYLNDRGQISRLTDALNPQQERVEPCCLAIRADGQILAYRTQTTDGSAWLNLHDLKIGHTTRLLWPTDVPAQAPQLDDQSLW